MDYPVPGFPSSPHTGAHWVSSKDTNTRLPSLGHSDLTEMDCKLNIRI